MRKALTIITLLTFFGAFAQKEVGKKVNELIARNVTFKPYSVLAVAPNNPDAKIKQVVEKATFATIKSDALAQLVANKNAFIELAIPYLGETVTMQLYQVDIFAAGFHVDTDKGTYIPYEKGVYYRGIVKGDDQSVAAFSFFNNELTGLVSSDRFDNLVVGKLDRANNTSDYIIYSDADMNIMNDAGCHTSDDDIKENTNRNDNTTSPETVKCATMYFEMDYNLYLSSSSNTTTATNWMTSVFNNVQTLYNNDGMTTALKSIFIWTIQDPYEGESSSDYLNQFNEVRPIFDGDLGQLVGIDSGGLGGVARTIDGLCSNNNYSYSDVNYSYSTVPTYSWTIMVITHEFGHLLGSPHTHACIWNGNNTPIDSCGPYSIGSTGEGFGCMADPPLLPTSATRGTIMSYCHLLNVGIRLSNGFGPQPKDRVLNAMNGATCLGNTCTDNCVNSVVEINTAFVGSTANITWEQLGTVTNWLISVTPTGSAANWVPVTGTSYSISNLSPNTHYKVQLKPNCDAAITVDTVSNFFLTDAPYCDGIVLTDSGGTTGNYSNNENYVRTIIPNVADKKIKLTFTSFFLIGQDRLFIFDGNSTSAVDLTVGGLTGNTIPSSVESTASDGSLTIQFVSDATLIRPGFAANVTCVGNLGTNNYEPYIDFTYSPNPADGLVSITSRTAITEVSVYNNLGQLLHHSNVNAKDAKVDLTAFATGTYFFKLKFNNREANFKILKK